MDFFLSVLEPQLGFLEGCKGPCVFSLGWSLEHIHTARAASQVEISLAIAASRAAGSAIFAAIMHQAGVNSLDGVRQRRDFFRGRLWGAFAFFLALVCGVARRGVERLQ